MRVKAVTPIEIVEEIEPVLELWTTLGFEKLAEVADEGRLGFVLLARGAVHVMLQSRRSVEKDVPAVAALNPRSALYIDVESLDEVLPALTGLEVVVPERTTFYGAREVFVRDSQGRILGFAEHHHA